jgi:perosamine synthetase
MIWHIPHSRPSVGIEEKHALNRVIASGQLAGGPEVKALERELPLVVGHPFGVAVSSGTAALYLALRSLNVGKGDEVVIPSYVCTALLNAVNCASAIPVLCDVDPRTGLMTPASVKQVLTSKTRVVIVPHLFGYPADAVAIQALGVPVIEDCAQCIGATLNGVPVGGTTKMSIFSFYGTKFLSAGEGGLVATSDKNIAQRIINLREYDNQEDYTFRFNFKLSDLQAAVARQQVKKLPLFIESRRSIALHFRLAIDALAPNIASPPELPGADPVYYRFVVRTTAGVDAAIAIMRKRGIICARPVFKPLHHYLKKEGFPGSDAIYNEALSIPCYPALKKNEIEDIIMAFETLKS